MTGREFRKEWLSEFVWLDYDAKEGQMHCKVCKETLQIKLTRIAPSSAESFHVSNIKQGPRGGGGGV